MAYLVLVRHGQSEWNALGLWTGQHDVSLTEQGRQEARKAAKALEDMTLHKAHVSKLKRAHETLDEIKEALKHTELETVEHEALNERSYGDYTGKDKWQMKELLGEDEFNKVRRAWDHPVPNGETLKDVHDRAVPYFQEHILADLKAGKNVIVSAHGNSLRSLVKHLEQIPEDEVHAVEIGTGEVHVYEINEDGTVISKTIRAKGAAA